MKACISSTVIRWNNLQSWSHKVDLGNILKLVGWKMFTRKSLRLKWTNESLPTALGLIHSDFYYRLGWVLLSDFGLPHLGPNRLYRALLIMWMTVMTGHSLLFFLAAFLIHWLTLILFFANKVLRPDNFNPIKFICFPRERLIDLKRVIKSGISEKACFTTILSCLRDFF